MGNSIITVDGLRINVSSINEQDYICLTDMVRSMDNGLALIEKWLRNKNTLEFLGVWEQLNNSSFNSPEFEGIKNSAGLNRFVISVRQWIERTNSIGIIAKAGRYGGTYAHKDIAIEFASWISPVFKLYLIKEIERLKEIESSQYNLEWNIRRILSKGNYKIHTDAVDKYIIPQLTVGQKRDWIYADEGDVLNIALFGCTAKQWRVANPDRAKKGENIRDMASINELLILSNIESQNATLIKHGVEKKQRIRLLSEIVKEQKDLLDKADVVKSIKKTDPTVYLPDNWIKEK